MRVVTRHIRLSRLRFGRVTVGTCGALCLVALALPGAASGQALDWEMKPRMKRPEAPDQRYFAAAGAGRCCSVDTRKITKDWDVTVSYCVPGAAPQPYGSYRFTLAGQGVMRSSPPSPECRADFDDLPRLGVYNVAVTVDGRPGSAITMTLRDRLVVSMGDSFGSGEGVLEEQREAEWEDTRCHRSSHAAAYRAAWRLEQRDRRSSVTFIHLACSGAKIADGLLSPYAGIRPEGDEELAPQILALSDLIGARTVDALLLSVGGNDFGFSPLITNCILSRLLHVIGRGGCDEPGTGADKIYRTGLPRVTERYRWLKQTLAAVLGARLPAAGVHLIEYPDFTHDDDGSFCDFGGRSSPLRRREWQWASEVVARNLSIAMRAAAARPPAWTWVSGVSAEFDRHGYCARNSFIAPLGDSFIAQLLEERRVRTPTRAFHPNLAGQQAIARVIYDNHLSQLP